MPLNKLTEILKRQSLRLSSYFKLSATARSVQNEKLTYLGLERMSRLEAAVKRALKRNVPGSIAEFGIALGGSAIVLATYARRYDRSFHGFDVFGMIPPPVSDKDDAASKKRFEIIASGQSKGIMGDEYYGYKKDLYNEVCRSFQRHGLPVDGVAVVLHKGLFSDTLTNFPTDPIAFAHVDCDWYDPVKLCLQEIAKRSSIGTTIILDDFNDWRGCHEATLEFLKDHPQYDFDSGPNVILTRTR